MHDSYFNSGEEESVHQLTEVSGNPVPLKSRELVKFGNTDL